MNELYIRQQRWQPASSCGNDRSNEHRNSWIKIESVGRAKYYDFIMTWQPITSKQCKSRWATSFGSRHMLFANSSTVKLIKGVTQGKDKNWLHKTGLRPLKTGSFAQYFGILKKWLLKADDPLIEMTTKAGLTVFSFLTSACCSEENMSHGAHTPPASTIS